MAALAQRSADHDRAPVVSQDEQAHNPLDDVLIERAKQALVGRYGFLPGEAFEVLSGLAHSQQRPIEEFAESVIESGGRLDGA
jgi:AmiR/NasT family two-component response regulator